MGENRDLFMPDLAERLKERAGQPFRPANGFEGDKFMELWCEGCSKDLNPLTGERDACPIILATMFMDTSDPEYPKAWTYSDRGQPVCSEFEAKPLANAEPAGGGL